MADDNSIARRNFLLGAGTAVATSLAPTAEAQTQSPAAPTNEPQPLLVLSATEATFMAAVADTMIPADALSPSGSECGIVAFADRQLASAWGGGAKMYRSGPFRKGKPEHGYQLGLSPREFFATGIAAVNVWTKRVHGREFDRLTPQEREGALKTLEAGKAELGDFNGRQFFGALLDLVMEGFLSDPIYGGNKDKAAWKMIGYPGLPAVYANKVEEYRHKRYSADPQSIADFS